MSDGCYDTVSSRGCTDWHHFLWARISWNKREWSNKLRNHKYCGSYIEREGLHNYIHEKMNFKYNDELSKTVRISQGNKRDRKSGRPIIGTPVPTEKVCASVYGKIEEHLKQGIICLNDPIEVKLATLIEYFSDCDFVVDFLRDELRTIREYKKNQQIA